MATTERWFSDEELTQMSRPTMDRAIEALDNGDTATVQVTIRGVDTPDDQLRGTHYRPKTLRLDWADGGCQTVTLKDDAALQRFAVRQGAVGAVTVTVVSGYPPASAAAAGGGAAGDVLDIGEVTVWKR